MQSTIEIAAFIAVVGIALIILLPYIKRAIEGSYRKAAHSFLE